MIKCVRTAIVALTGLLFPFLASAQVADEIHSMKSMLEGLYDDMMPLCSHLIGVGRGIAGFAATWYIASRIWGHISRAEPVDFYPLFRPFVMGFAVLIFPSLIAMINGVMNPTVAATETMVENSDKAIAALLKLKEDAIKKTVYWQMYVGASGEGDQDKWYEYTYNEDPSEEGWIEGIGHSVQFAMSKFYYNFKNSIKEWLSEILKVFYEAAALCINTIRTFNLIVMAILGPLAFGIGVFDGFQHTVTSWIARYLNFFLWLPVANIFGAIMGKIQENMLKLDISQIQDQGDTFFSSTDVAYLIFMIIGICGYFTIPSVANYIIQAGGGNGFVHRVTQGFNSATNSVTNNTMSAASSVTNTVGGAFSSSGGSGSDYQRKRIEG
jgi:conjugative transposon TraJ protein